MEILTKRLAYIDAMRGFTMILVVFSHVQYFGYGELYTKINSEMKTNVGTSSCKAFLAMNLKLIIPFHSTSGL